MADLWTTEFSEIFQDRFLRLSRISITAPMDQLIETLTRLKTDYLENLQRLREAFQKKKKIKYGLLAGGVVLPILCLSFIVSGKVSGLWLLFLLAFSAGAPYYVFKWYLPRFYRVVEFYRRYQGAEGRIDFALECLNGSNSGLSPDPIELFLALEGLDIDEQAFYSKMGTSTGQGEFRDSWFGLTLTFEEHFKFDLTLFKKVKVDQTYVPGKEEGVFSLQRKIDLWGQAELEITLDENHYQGFLQFRDRDWEQGEHKLAIEKVSAGSFSMGIQAQMELLKEVRADKLLGILGEINGKQIELKEVLELMDFAKGHFLKKQSESS